MRPTSTPTSDRGETADAVPRLERRAETGDYRIGLLCLVGAAFFASLAGVILRHVEAADGWQQLFYRSLSFVAVMLLYLLMRHGCGIGPAFRAVGRLGFAVMVFLTAALTAFLLVLLETTVANVVFTVHLSPFFAALFAWIVLREAVGVATLAAMALSLAGVGFMFADGLTAGTLAGNFLAPAACLCYSATLVALRKGRDVDMLPAVCLAGLLGTAVSGAVALGVSDGGLAVSPRDLGLAIALGVFQLGFQYILLTIGTRQVPAAEVALVGRPSLMLAPLWVWLVVDEVPGDLTLIGGAIVLAAILGHGLAARRRLSSG